MALRGHTCGAGDAARVGPLHTKAGKRERAGQRGDPRHMGRWSGIKLAS